jgi:hypothetical protein
MWQVYLDMNHYAAALSHCRNPFQRDQVYLVQVLIIYLDAAITFCSLHKTSICYFLLLYLHFRMLLSWSSYFDLAMMIGG